MVEARFMSERLLLKNGMSPQRIRTISRLPSCRLSRMTGWKVAGGDVVLVGRHGEAGEVGLDVECLGDLLFVGTSAVPTAHWCCLSLRATHPGTKSRDLVSRHAPAKANIVKGRENTEHMILTHTGYPR
jgi:hypothetical protein